MRRFIYSTLHPENYHGHGEKPPFFEGWYYKLVDASEQKRYAVIPGVFITQNSADNHAFIQVLDGISAHATYHSYPMNAFYAHEEAFEVRVGNSRFTRNRIDLDIDEPDQRITGTLYFESLVPWPITLRSPGIMGWYAWVPFMETYHGVVSMDHSIRGTLNIDGQPIDFSRGRGYTEKDWGQNFPSGYVWQQSNHFDTPGTSLSASIAMIPSMGRSFAGFIIGLWHQGTLFRFATYTGAVVEQLKITDDHVYWTVRDRSYRLEMISERATGGLLKAPIRTEMHKRVDETINAAVDVKLSTLEGRSLLDERGRIAALEVHGDLDTLVASV